MVPGFFVSQTNHHMPRVEPNKSSITAETHANCLDITAKESLSQETVLSLAQLGEVLRGIDARIRREGYTVKNGKLIKRHGK